MLGFLQKQLLRAVAGPDIENAIIAAAAWSGDASKITIDDATAFAQQNQPGVASPMIHLSDVDNFMSTQGVSAFKRGFAMKEFNRIFGSRTSVTPAEAIAALQPLSAVVASLTGGKITVG